MKKGYLLIELIVCMSLMGIIITFTLFNINKYNRQANDIKVRECAFSIASLINNSKLYCRQAGVSGRIILFAEDQKMCFYINGNLVEKVTAPNGIKLNTFKTPGLDNVIRINEKGITSDACTISFRDMYDVNHYITVSVGSTYVEIKE